MPQIIRTFQLTETQNHIVRRVEPKGFSAYIRRLIAADMTARGIMWEDDTRPVGRPPKKEGA